MRIGLGIAELGGDSIFQALRNEMLQAFGLLMHFVPRVIEHIMQKSFEQAMMPKNLQRAMLARVRQDDAVMLFILDQGRLQCRELLKHPRYRGGTHAEPIREGVSGDTPFFGPAHLPYRLQIIVDRFRVDRGPRFTWH